MPRPAAAGTDPWPPHSSHGSHRSTKTHQIARESLVRVVTASMRSSGRGSRPAPIGGSAGRAVVLPHGGCSGGCRRMRPIQPVCYKILTAWSGQGLPVGRSVKIPAGTTCQPPGPVEQAGRVEGAGTAVRATRNVPRALQRVTQGAARRRPCPRPSAGVTGSIWGISCPYHQSPEMWHPVLENLALGRVACDISAAFRRDSYRLCSLRGV
jgi:hypothetical protein